MNYCYTSKLAPYIIGYLKEGRSSGFAFITHTYALWNFDRFVQTEGFDYGLLDKKLVEAWAIQRESENLNSRNSRVLFVRQLARYIQGLGIDAYVIPSFGSEQHTVPYIPTRYEIAGFLQVVDQWQNKCLGEVRRTEIEYPILFRLYYCCGMRLNEAVQLHRDDVDLTDGKIYIRQAKGDNDRIIYLTQDFLQLVRSYNEKMDALVHSRKWFFPGYNKSKPFSKTNLDRKFRQFWYLFKPNHTGKHPTIHCLRHAFVVHRMNNWVADGKNLSDLMPYLSRHLGHSSIAETIYYYHQFDVFSPAVRNYIELCGSVSKEVANEIL